MTNRSNLEDLSDQIRSVIAMMPSQEIVRCMQLHYQYLGMTENGVMVMPELEREEEQRIFSAISKADLHAHWDAVFDNIKLIDGLPEFINTLSSEVYNEIKDRFKRYNPKQKIEILTFGFALDKLNRVLLEDPKLYVKYNQYLFGLKKPRVNSVLTHAFIGVKRKLVEVGILKTTKILSGRISLRHDVGRDILFFNIREAAFFEGLKGYKENAIAGKVLASERIGSKKYDPQTGAGPTIYNAQRTGLLVRMALPKQWMELYTNWNMAFVSILGGAPITIQKLLIPSVLQDRTGNEYLYRRALALYLTIRYWDLRTYDFHYKNEKDHLARWKSPKLTAAWGNFNKNKAFLYQQKVEKLRKNKTIQSSEVSCKG